MGLTLKRLAFELELLPPTQSNTQRTCFSGQPCQVVVLSVLALLAIPGLLSSSRTSQRHASFIPKVEVVLTASLECHETPS